MAKSLEAFPVSADGFSLPVNDVLTGRGFVTGKSGSGKSNTASVIAEELLERGLGIMIVDTDGEYHGLKERYELLHVGADDECDRKVNVEDARFLADLALEENVPIILDVSAYMDEDESKEVIHAVVKELFVMEKSRQKPFLLFIEEAHEFIPEQGGGDDLTKMLIRIAKRGRKRGLGVVAMSQRPAAVSKDYITQCDWLIWHRLTWENDTKVAGRILGGDARESIQSMDTGEAMVMTDWDESIRRVQFRRKKTVDAGSTPTLQEAYGPPSSRDDHLAEAPEDEAAEAADTESSAEAGEAGEGDEAGQAGAGAHADDAAVESVGEGGAVEADEAGDDRMGPPDDLEADADAGTDADAGADGDAGPGSVARAEPRGRTNEAGANTELVAGPGSVNEPSPDERVAVKEKVARRAAMNRADDEGQDADGASAVSDAGGPPVLEGETHRGGSGAGGSDHATVTDRFELDEPDEWDPVWEIGQLFVYVYGAVVGMHVRLVRFLERAMCSGQARTRRLLWGPNAAAVGRVERLAARALAVAFVVTAYAVGCLAVIGALSG